MSYDKISLKLHKKLSGKISISPKVNIKDIKDLSIFYTPGIAAVSKEIAKNTCRVWDYTARKNLVAVVTDGSAVLGLGNIGPEAAHPVMAGKALLFKEFADIDAFPICLDSQDPKDIIKTCKLIAPSFGGINLEDISAPRCFEIESALQSIGIPVMHDDQHGTAVVVLAGLINATKVVNKKLENCKIIVNGPGAAGTAIALAIAKFTKNKARIIALDEHGVVCTKEDKNKRKICQAVSKKNVFSKLDIAIKGADIFIGVSVGDILSKENVESMSKDPIVFAMANPIPEIDPKVARSAGVAIIATGRSDYPNQVNNVLAFPGIFRGALDANATKITPEMLLVASSALAKCVKNPTVTKILPGALEKSVVTKIANAVKLQAKRQGVSRPKCV